MPALVNLPSLIDDARCFELVRQHRWPEGVRCPYCEAANVARDGRDDAQPHRQRYRCVGCGARFDDLTGTVLAGRHRPLRLRVPCLYLTGLSLSDRRIARELDLVPAVAGDGGALAARAADALGPAVLPDQLEASRVIDQGRQVHQGWHERHRG